MKRVLHRRASLVGLLLGLAILGVGRLWAAGDAPDLDGDGIPNLIDLDIDNDGLPNAIDPNVDGGVALTGPYAGRYIGDHLENDHPAELDIDGDDQRDDALGETDIDGDGNADNDDLETDIDGDGRPDDALTELDLDGDGLADDAADEADIDGDGLDDDAIDEDDIDGDGLSDELDDDIDGDGRLNSAEDEDDVDGDGLLNDDPAETNEDGDDLDDALDDDDDNDGILDDDDADHHPEEGERAVVLRLDRLAAPGGSEAVFEIQHFGYGKTKFDLHVEGLDLGTVDLVVDGVVRASLPLSGGNLEVEFETNPDDEDERPLDFAIFGLPVELRDGSTVLFSGTFPDAPALAGESEEHD